MPKQNKMFPGTQLSPAPEVRPLSARPGWGAWQDWVNIVLLYIVLEIAVLSVEQARWITPQPSLSLVLFLSLLVVYVLYRVRIFGVFKHLLALVIGLAATLWQTLSLIAPPAGESKFSHLLNIMQSWWQGGGTLLPGEDKLPFAIFIIFLTWVVGYLSLWFLLRRNNGWVAVILGTLVILFNLANLPDTYFIYFFLYFFAAALLIAVTHMTGRQFKAGGTANYSGRSLFYLGVSLLVITTLAASVAWLAPQVRAPALQDLIATKLSWQGDVLGSKFNIFNAVPAKQAVSTASILKDLTFGEGWNQGDDIIFVVNSERPAYWRMNIYDTYTSQGWTNSLNDKNFLEPGMPWTGDETLSNRETVQYAVTTEIYTDVLLNNGGFVSADIPVRVNADAVKGVMAVTAIRILDPDDRYIVTSHVASPAESDLSRAGMVYPDSIKATYLQLPAYFSESIRLLSENITAAAPTPYAKVGAVIGYLSHFTYRLEVDLPPAGTDSVAYFLFTGKKGYCLHFASAAVVMLRSVGIPSRLAVGYLPGEPGNVPGQYLLRDKYYHAWPQVYFPGYGWVDIEATPPSPESQVTVATPWISGSAIAASPQWNIWMGAPYPSGQDITNIGVVSIPGGAIEETESLSFAAKMGSALLFIFIAALIIALLIGLILIIRSLSYRWLWRVDRNAVAYGAYVNMCRLAAMVGLVPRPQQTPLEFTAELVGALPQEAEPLNYIARAYVENCFGGRDGKPGLAEEAEILKARNIVYNALIRRLGRVRRLAGKR